MLAVPFAMIELSLWHGGEKFNREDWQVAGKGNSAQLSCRVAVCLSTQNWIKFSTTARESLCLSKLNPCDDFIEPFCEDSKVNISDL